MSSQPQGTMSIRNLFRLVFGSLFLLLAVLVIAALLMSSFQERTFDAANRRYESYRVANTLRQSSDDLTRMARLYATTGDPIYEQYFHDILAIRNGERPQPKGFGTTYWDLRLANPNLPTSESPPESLDAQMRRLRFSQEELAKLAQARERSDELTGLEREAMALVKGLSPDATGAYTVQGTPQLERARELLHGPRYHAAKAKIMYPINEFFDLLDERTTRETNELVSKSRTVSYATVALVVLLSATAITGAYLLRKRAVVPLGHMAHVVDRISDAPGGVELLPESNDELGTVGRAIGKLLLQTGDAVRALTQARDFAEEMQKQLYSVQSDFETLSFVVAHDFRSPVHAVHEYATFVLHEGRLSAEDVEYMRKIVATSERLTGMLDGMLRLAKTSSAPLRVQRVDLTELAAECLEELRGADPTRQVVVEIAPTMWAYGDLALLRVLLTNLLSNAWKFTRSAATPKIEMRVAEEEPEGRTRFAVIDNGVGFDPSLSAKLFRMFGRLHDETQYSGTGIGLATAKRIVERHGGTIAATSVPGVETTFTFTLTTTLKAIVL